MPSDVGEESSFEENEDDHLELLTTKSGK